LSARHAQEVPIAPRPKRKAPPAAVRSLVKAIEASLDADKAENIVRIPLAGKSSIADFMVIASGSNHLVEKLKERGRSHVPVEGRQQGDWVLVDAGDVIVHLFRPDARSHYALEKMWQAEFDEEAGAAAG
jgi:ribosome silencing factor RsfS/YbeB/iojap